MAWARNQYGLAMAFSKASLSAVATLGSVPWWGRCDGSPRCVSPFGGAWHERQDLMRPSLRLPPKLSAIIGQQNETIRHCCSRDYVGYE